MTSRMLAQILLLTSLAEVSAFWRLLCDNPVTVGRYDPIVSPGNIAGHSHTIAGGSGFGMSTSYDQMRNASCTSCQVTQDLSNYWVPSLYYQNPNNGSFEDVQTIGGMTVYYLQRGNNPRAFPPGFKMLAGNPMLRSWSDTLEQGAVSFVCLDYNAGSSSSTGLPTKNCPQGLRAQVVLPSCWNGKDLDSADHKSHMAYPSGVSTGDCPAGYPIRFVTLFYEVTFIVNSFASRWYPERQQPFVFANGDPTGYGFHGDFIMGWNQTFLQSAIDTCTASSGLQEDCPLFNLSRGQQCHITPQVNEIVSGNLTKLPGCNPIQFGPSNAVPQTCTDPKPQVWNDTYQYKGSTAPPQSHFLANQPQTVQKYSSWSYSGCWSDSNARTLPTKVGTGNTLTVETCLDACNAAGYPYAGLEAAAECWCGNVFPSLVNATQLTYAGCGQTCPDNSTELCGGSWALSVYNNSAITPPAIPATSSDKSATYLGCYQDGSTRTMEYSAGNTNSTIDGCVSACSLKGYAYSGIEYMGQCFCSSSQPSSSLLVGDTQCNMQCSGDRTKYCGAGYRLQTYRNTIITSSQIAQSMPYAGCYTDGNPRSLAHRIPANNTVDSCLSACRSSGYTIAGLEYGGECWCDNVVNIGMQKAPEGECSMSCSNNPSQKCGAGNRLSVYNSTALIVPTMQTNVGGQRYLGCYTDDSNRVMQAVNSPNSTINGCIAACSSKGFGQSGIEYGGQCFCGSLASRSIKVGDGECNMSCNDDPRTLCGSGNRLQVYSNSTILQSQSSSSSTRTSTTMSTTMSTSSTTSSSSTMISSSTTSSSSNLTTSTTSSSSSTGGGRPAISTTSSTQVPSAQRLAAMSTSSTTTRSSSMRSSSARSLSTSK